MKGKQTKKVRVLPRFFPEAKWALSGLPGVWALGLGDPWASVWTCLDLSDKLLISAAYLETGVGGLTESHSLAMRKQGWVLPQNLRGRREHYGDLLHFAISGVLAVFGTHDRHQDCEQVDGVPRNARKEQAGEGQHSLDKGTGWSIGWPVQCPQSRSSGAYFCERASGSPCQPGSALQC